MRSWYTTTGGICCIVIAIASAVKSMVDDDPTTTIDIQTIITSLGFFFPGLIGIWARDNGKSSEDVGVK
jgi:hypothetical protein